MRFLIACIASVLFAFSTTQIGADEPDAPNEKKSQQIWEGTLDVGVAKLRLRFEISHSQEGDFTGHLISIDQGNAKVPLSAMSVDGDKVTMEFKAAGAKFEGKRQENSDTCVGKWHQAGKPYDLTIKRVTSASQRKHIQSWHGDLMAGPKTFDLQLRIESDKSGKQHCRLDNFSQKTLDVQTEFEQTKEGFKFRLLVAKASFTGAFNDDKSEISGHWTQSGNDLPLTFKKIPLDDTRLSLPIPKRPQHPKAPFPYVEEQVTFRNQKDGVELAGTLTLPNKTGRFPAVILITGSGPQDRDETLFHHKPFLVIADHLTRKGIAVLRYDDRGIGKSDGTFSGATTEDFSRDAESGIDFLKKHDSIDSSHIGLIGHSEGGVIGPMIAARRADVAMVVMLAGPGITGAEISTSQSRAMSKAAGLADDFVDTQEEALVALIEETKRLGKPLTEERIDQLLEKIASTSDEKRAHIELLESAVKRLADPWMADYISSDPGSDLRKVKCPVLALNGEKDLQVLPDLNLKAIQKHLEAAGNKDFKTVELPGLNHLFQTSETGQMSEYGDIEETFSPIALNEISKWILERTN